MIGNIKAIVLYLLFIALSSSSLALSNEQLDTADSLFLKQKYTEAFAIYTAIFTAGDITESMLVKMAFIKEGLGDYVKALYYLDQYYNVTADKSVLVKMQELANENELNGYRVEDKDFFLNFLNLYWLELQLVLLAISVFLLVFTYQSRKKKRLPFGVPILQLIVLAVFLILSNDWMQTDTTIIQSPTLLMSGPSAGAEPIGWVNKGHKIVVLDELEVWTKIQWKDGDAYIRNSKLEETSNP